MKLNKTFKLIASILICHLAGVIGSFFTISSVNSWYLTLLKPTFSPPNWIFAPVWLTLYTLMGIALYLIWKDGLQDNRKKFAFNLFLVHLIFNALWSIVFFGFQSPLWALVIILILLLMIVAIMFEFWKINKISAYLLIPYFLWVSFATILNYYIWFLN